MRDDEGFARSEFEKGQVKASEKEPAEVEKIVWSQHETRKRGKWFYV